MARKTVQKGKRSMLRNIVVGMIAVGVLLGFVLDPALAQKLTPFRMAVPWLPDGQFSFAFVAKEKGFFQKRGLDVTIDNLKGSMAAVNAIGGGQQYDAVIADMGNMIVGVGRGFELIDLAMIQYKCPSGVIALASKGIEKPKDLEGKIYLTTPGSGELVAWKAFVKINGIDESKVKVTYAEPRVWDSMILEGKGDYRGSFYAAVAPSYWARGIKFKQILFADWGLEMYSNSVVTRQEALQKKPEVLRAFTEAILEGLKYTYLYPEESVESHLKAVPDYRDTPENRALIRHGIGCTAALGLVNTPKDNGLGWMDPRVVEKTIDIIATYLGLEKRPSPDKVFTNRFAGSVKMTAAEWERALALHKKYILPD